MPFEDVLQPDPVPGDVTDGLFLPGIVTSPGTGSGSQETRTMPTPVTVNAPDGIVRLSATNASALTLTLTATGGNSPAYGPATQALAAGATNFATGLAAGTYTGTVQPTVGGAAGPLLPLTVVVGSEGGSSAALAEGPYTVTVNAANSVITITGGPSGANLLDYAVLNAAGDDITSGSAALPGPVTFTARDGQGNPLPLTGCSLLLTASLSGADPEQTGPFALAAGGPVTQGGGPLPAAAQDVDPQWGPAVFGIVSGRTAAGYAGLSDLHVTLISCLSNVDGSDQTANLITESPVFYLSASGLIAGAEASPGEWGQNGTSGVRYVGCACGSGAGSSGFPTAAGDYFVFVFVGGVVYPVGQVTLIG